MTLVKQVNTCCRLLKVKFRNHGNHMTNPKPHDRIPIFDPFIFLSEKKRDFLYVFVFHGKIARTYQNASRFRTISRYTGCPNKFRVKENLKFARITISNFQKNRQIEGRSALLSSNVNKVSRFLFAFCDLKDFISNLFMPTF